MWAVQLLRNFGQAGATMCGLTHARGRSLITLDDDLQHPPEEIPVLVEALGTNPDLDVVIGIPDEKRHAYWRRVGSDIVNAMNSFSLKKPRALRLSGFRAMRRLVAEQLVERNVPKPALGALLYSTMPRIANVTVHHEPRHAGQSGYTLAKILSLTLSNFLAFSDFPLRLMALAGAVGIAISLVVGIRILLRYLQVGVVVPGWLTLALLLVGISGLNFFAFGLMGEYLLRVLQSVQHTPQYFVRQKVPVPERTEDLSSTTGQALTGRGSQDSRQVSAEGRLFAVEASPAPGALVTEAEELVFQNAQVDLFLLYKFEEHVAASWIIGGFGQCTVSLTCDLFVFYGLAEDSRHITHLV